MKKSRPEPHRRKTSDSSVLKSSTTCIHYPECGGCDTINLPYETSLKRKVDSLRKIFGDFSRIKILPALSSPLRYHYRHKIQLPFGRMRDPSNKGILSVPGLLARNRSHIIPMKECLIQDESLTAVVLASAKWAKKNRLSPYDERTGKGLLRYILLRKGSGTGEILATVVLNKKGPLPGGNLARTLLHEIELSLLPYPESRLVGLLAHPNMMRNNLALDPVRKSTIWWGRDYLNEEIDHFRFRIEAGTFFQVNPSQIPRLYGAVVDAIGSGQRVLELHAGLAAISHFLSRKASEVVAVEENKDSVRLGRMSLNENGINNVNLTSSESRSAMRNIVAGKMGEFDVVVVDPPREGLDEGTLKGILRMKVKRIVYVSCNPVTLHRDALALSRSFTLLSLQPVDLFPFTEHLESVAIFDSKISKLSQ